MLTVFEENVRTVALIASLQYLGVSSVCVSYTFAAEMITLCAQWRPSMIGPADNRSWKME